MLRPVAVNSIVMYGKYHVGSTCTERQISSTMVDDVTPYEFHVAVCLKTTV
jgi:hypothetical protein